MVRDGYYYGLACLAVALLLGWLTSPWAGSDSLSCWARFFCGFSAIPNARYPQPKALSFRPPTAR